MANRFEHLRAYLERERNRLSEQPIQSKTGEETEEKRRESSFGKRGEASLASSESERGLALQRRTKEQLAEVEHALEKLERGTYGLCDRCGKDIPLERLEAIPETSMCVECKAKHSGTL